MSRICLGLMRIADKSVNEVHELLIGSLNMGITHLDLADIYGRGECERLVGEVFKLDPSLRDKFYIQSKVGINPGKGYDSSYEYLLSATKKCLERLNIKTLDCLLIHRPDIFTNNKEVSKFINAAIKENYIKDFGVSNYSSSQIRYLQKEIKTPIKYNQVNLGLGNLTMVEQTFMTNVPSYKNSKESDDLFFFLKDENIAIQAWSPFQYGFFEGSIFDENRFPQINEVLNKYAQKYNTSKCAIATAFLLKLSDDLIVITGSTSLDHIKECKDGENINLSKEDWYNIYTSVGYLLP